MKKIKVLMAIFTMMTAGVFGYIKTAKASSEPTGKTAVMQATSSDTTVPVATASIPNHKDGIFAKINLADLLATLVYSFLGLFIALLGYKIYDWITPFDLRKELEIDQNTALGIVAGAIILGLCIIVAAAIMSP